MKRRIFLASVLALVITLCCAIFAACGGEKQTVTWDLNENVTVVAEGYDTLPTELEKGTVVTFSVTPKTGWAVTAVPGATKSGDKYTFTVADKNITVRVNLREIVSSIDVTPPTQLTYFAGEELDTTGMAVKVNYATGRNETTTSYTVTYQNGEAFSLGDTKFTVAFGDVSKDVTLTSAVLGKVVIDLDGGKYKDSDLDAFKDFTGYEYDEEKGTVTWTFDKAIAADITLPTPEKIINGSEFPFKNYNGVTDGKIAKDTVTSVKATAVYEPRLVEFIGLEFYNKTVTEEGKEVSVPILAITGKFVAATEAYLYLYEGNDKVELKGDTLTKGATDDFVLEFDLRKLYATNYVNKWMDIKFCATFGERVETQEINLTNYDEDFVNLGDFTQMQLEDGSWVRFRFEVHTPNGTNQKNLKVAYKADEYRSYKYREGRVRLENVEFDVPLAEGEGTEKKTLPALVIPVKYIDLSGEATKETVTEFANNYIKDMQVALQWTPVTMQKKVTVNDDFSFEIALSMENVQQGTKYVIHYFDGSNLTNKSIFDDTPLPMEGSDTLGYQFVVLVNQDPDWMNGWLNVHVVDISGRKNTTNLHAATLVAEGDKVYMVVTGTSEGYTAAMLDDLKAAVIKDGYVDGENSNGGEKTVLSEKVTFDFDAATGNYTIKVEITELGAGSQYWMHLGTATDVRNTSATTEAPVTPVTVGGKTYQFVAATESWGTAYRLEVKTA